MEKFIEPEIEIIRLQATDIIAASGGLDDDELPPIIVGKSGTTKQYTKPLILNVLLLALLLNGCARQPSVETVPITAQNIQSETESTGTEDEGELPVIIIPQQTEQETQPVQGQEDEKPSGGNSQSVTSAESTKGTEASVTNGLTEGTETTLPSRFDENELPPIPVG